MNRPTLLTAAFLVVCAAVRSPGQPADPAVVRLLNSISSDSLKRNIDRLAGFGTRHTLSDTVSDVRGIGAARRWIASEFRRYARRSEGRMSVRMHEAVLPPGRGRQQASRIVNVIATLGPTDPGPRSRMFLVSAHYDSRASDPMDAMKDAPGANDDGSGTALVLELARILAPVRFDATIVFACFAAEEQGLVGATAFAEDARAGQWNLDAVLNNDMVGNTTSGDSVTDRRSLRVFSQALAPTDTGASLRLMMALGLGNDGASRTLARYVKQIAGRYVPEFDVRLIYRPDRFLRSGDHRPFHDRGFAAVRLCEARENYDRQHQDVRTENGREYGDVPRYVDLEYLTTVTKINGAVLASLAFAPSPPTRVVLDAMALGYATSIHWKANEEPDLAGYRVLYRESSSSMWQHAIDVTDTAVTLKILKDDYLFAVQSVDKQGNASLPVLPKVGRRE